MNPCSRRSKSLMRMRRVGAGGATATGCSGPAGAGSVKTTSGEDRSRRDHGVAAILDKVSGHHLFGIGTRRNDLAVITPPSRVSMT